MKNKFLQYYNYVKSLFLGHRRLAILLIILFITILGASVYGYSVSREKESSESQTDTTNLISTNDTQLSQGASSNSSGSSPTQTNPNTTTPESSPNNPTSDSTSNNEGSAPSSTVSTTESPSSPQADSQSTSSSSGSSSAPSESDPEPEADPDSAPESPSATVAFYADSQTDTTQENEYHQNVVDNIFETSANPVFHAGDLMEDGTQQSLDYFNGVTATLRSDRTFYSALGNNDRKIGDSTTPSSLYLNNFSFPNNEKWYSINTGNLHMVVLDSAFSASSQAQLDWLESDLQSNDSQSRITGVMFHHPTFASSISSILENNGVDFVVSGHNHVYAHTTSNSIHYFVTSGQPLIGYFLAKVYSNSISMSVYNYSNALVETISIPNR